jgi:hypothetical protein
LAFPGVLVGKDDARRTVRTSHVAMLVREGLTVVTLTADFSGTVGPIAWLLPVPADVTLDRVRTGKREFLGRLEQVTAPRYHEFYEMNPCEPGEAKQDWEYHPKVDEPGLPVGTRLLPRDDGPVPREISIPLSPVFGDADSPYRFELLTKPGAGEVRAWLEARGYRLPAEVEQVLGSKLGHSNLLIAETHPEKLGLLPGGAELGAIRFWSTEPGISIPATLGLVHLSGRQDLIVYVLSPGQRYAAQNYKNLTLPTNLAVAAGANERLSELHGELVQALVLRHPRTALAEFAWPTDGCGEPCPNANLLPHELLSLGGDVIEERLTSSAERMPPPPEETEEEKAYLADKLKAAKPVERPRIEREHKEYRQELARRLALIGRHRYVLTRLRWSYDGQGLPEDPRVGPVGAIQGGAGTPRGPNAELEHRARPADENRYQVRYVRALPWSLPTRCEEAERWRWGRRWSSLGRHWRKVWTVSENAKSRLSSGNAQSLVLTPLPEIGWGPKPAPPATPPSPPRGCACRAGPRPGSVPSCLGLLGFGLVLAGRRSLLRRRSGSRRRRCAARVT